MFASKRNFAVLHSLRRCIHMQMMLISLQSKLYV